MVGNINISKNEYFELLRYKEMFQVMEQLIHERPFKEDFVKRILEAEERIKKGEKVQFRSVKEMTKYLDQIQD